MTYSNYSVAVLLMAMLDVPLQMFAVDTPTYIALDIVQYKVVQVAIMSVSNWYIVRLTVKNCP